MLGLMTGRGGGGERLLGVMVLWQGRDHPRCPLKLGTSLRKRHLGLLALLPGALQLRALLIKPLALIRRLAPRPLILAGAAGRRGALLSQLALHPLLVSERDGDRRHLDLFGPQLLSQPGQLPLPAAGVLVDAGVEAFGAGVKPGAFPSASQRDVGAIGVGVLTSDHMRTINRLPLSGERV